jgi:uncharacterized protein YggT (Ycf19 family)
MTDANRPGEGEPNAAEPTPPMLEPTSESVAEPSAAPGQPGQAAAVQAGPGAEAGGGPEPDSTAQPPSPPPPGQAPPPPAAPSVAPAAPARPAPPPPAPRRRTWPRTLIRLVTFLFGVLQALLILRIVLLLLIANPDNEIVSAILNVTQPFVDPFRDMFQLDEITGAQGSVLDIAAVVALIAWTLIEMLIVALLRLFDRQPTRR